ncbi:hypothetical protein NOCARDAX2BIS_140108 [Nocardioides sp. AX2bis]|nr:hypothetical protein NOCARDAX2BIS_140108 [Nocardioides sp. AX2bis]
MDVQDLDPDRLSHAAILPTRIVGVL